MKKEKQKYQVICHNLNMSDKDIRATDPNIMYWADEFHDYIMGFDLVDYLHEIIESLKKYKNDVGNDKIVIDISASFKEIVCIKLLQLANFNINGIFFDNGNNSDNKRKAKYLCNKMDIDLTTINVAKGSELFERSLTQFSKRKSKNCFGLYKSVYINQIAIIENLLIADPSTFPDISAGYYNTILGHNVLMPLSFLFNSEIVLIGKHFDVPLKSYITTFNDYLEMYLVELDILAYLFSDINNNIANNKKMSDNVVKNMDKLIQNYSNLLGSHKNIFIDSSRHMQETLQKGRILYV